MAPTFCSATLKAWKKNKTGIRFIAVGEVIRRLMAKCIEKEAALEAVDLFRAKQFGVAVRGGAESIVHVTKMTKKEDKKVGESSICFQKRIQFGETQSFPRLNKKHDA